MPSKSTTYDIFISHGSKDTSLAVEVAKSLQAHGLECFSPSALPAGANIEESMWQAMAESQALVVVIATTEPSTGIGFEIGAALAWGKPVYVIIADPANTQLSPMVSGAPGVRLYPPSRIDEVAVDIQRAQDRLSQEDIATLIGEYRRIGLPVDRLTLDAGKLSELTRNFHKHSHRQAPAERLIWHLLHLRKKGKLPAIKRSQSRKT